MGKKAAIAITVNQSLLDISVQLYVEINFSAEPSSFNTEGYIVPPLRCSDADLLWAMNLPPVYAAD